MARLKSTRAIFNGHLQTTYNLLLRTEASITSDYHKLNILRGSIIRATRPNTLEKIKARLSNLAREMGHTPPTSADKNKMLHKISTYKKQNSFLLYASIHQAIINICVIYEDLTRRIIMKYYEESIWRIPTNKETMKNIFLIEAIVRGDNIHHALAQKVTDDLMYGNVDKWHKVLKGMGMKIVAAHDIEELFLVRNCIVHNNGRVSGYLNTFMPDKYHLRQDIRPTVDDVKRFKDDVHRFAFFITSEYGRIFPVSSGTWL